MTQMAELIARATIKPWLMAPPALAEVHPQDLLPGARSYLNVPFAFVPGFRPLALDLHVPVRTSIAVPVVVYAHGGGFFTGVKGMGGWDFLPREGYAVASVEYRLRSEAPYPGPLHDMKAAVRWLRANAGPFNLDPARIAGWGASAGGYLLSLLALTNANPEFEGTVGSHTEYLSAVSACIDFYAPVDWLNMPDDDRPDTVERTGTPTSSDTLFLGYIPRTEPQRAREASPIAHVSSDAPPFLILHGDADVRVGVNQSRRLHSALQAAGADSTLDILPGASHGMPDEAWTSPEVHALILAFLDRTVGKTMCAQDRK